MKHKSAALYMRLIVSLIEVSNHLCVHMQLVKTRMTRRRTQRRRRRKTTNLRYVSVRSVADVCTYQIPDNFRMKLKHGTLKCMYAHTRSHDHLCPMTPVADTPLNVGVLVPIPETRLPPCPYLDSIAHIYYSFLRTGNNMFSHARSSRATVIPKHLQCRMTRQRRARRSATRPEKRGTLSTCRDFAG